MVNSFKMALLASAAIGMLAGPGQAQTGEAGTAAMPIGVITLERQAVPQSVSLPGRAVAFQEVDLRPRIGGVIQEVLYEPGQLLEVGAPLFRIDDAAYRAAVASDEAILATAEANLPVAEAAVARAEKLVERGYTEAELESLRAEMLVARAELAAAEAALDYSETELSWTTITSPIEGRADVASVSVGDLVTAGQSDALTTITRSDPIYVDMLEASARMLAIRAQIADGSLNISQDLSATLTLENGEVYRGSGKMVTPGNSVSTSTGTFTIRFQFDNPDALILPGMFMRGEIEIGTVEAFLVPQRAASRNSSGGLTVYVIGEDGTAQSRSVSDSGSFENAWIIREGLTDGDQLIVDGLKNLRPGQAVTPVPVTLDANGITHDSAQNGAGQ